MSPDLVIGEAESARRQLTYMAFSDLKDRSLENFKDWLGRRLPDCRTITPTMSASLDGGAGRWRRLMIRIHLFTCERCGLYLDQIRFLSRTVRENAETLSAEGCVDECDPSESFKRKLKNVLGASLMSAA